jgi:tetraacyldisaccharide 4'-kinase
MMGSLMDERSILSILSGQRRDLAARLLRGGCAFASLGYAATIAARNAAFDLGWRRVQHVGVPVVSVGNITTGGTGKTPLVAWIAQRFQERLGPVAIVSRGYRAHQDGKNDEALVLERLCPGVPQVLNRDRVAGARKAVQEFGSRAIVLDDAFQHRRIFRDLDLVLVDALNPWGYGHLLPRGLLREPLSALKRADAVLITRADQVDAATLDDLRRRIARIRGIDEHIAVCFAPTGVIYGDGLRLPLTAIDRSVEYGAFCGIGNPIAFQRTLADLGIKATLRTYPDHYHYTAADWDDLSAWSQQFPAGLLTTLKDVVKLPPTHPLAEHVAALDIGVEFLAGRQHLDRRLETLAPNALRAAA